MGGSALRPCPPSGVGSGARNRTGGLQKTALTAEKRTRNPGINSAWPGLAGSGADHAGTEEGLESGEEPAPSLPGD